MSDAPRPISDETWSIMTAAVAAVNATAPDYRDRVLGGDLPSVLRPATDAEGHRTITLLPREAIPQLTPEDEQLLQAGLWQWALKHDPTIQRPDLLADVILPSAETHTLLYRLKTSLALLPEWAQAQIYAHWQQHPVSEYYSPDTAFTPTTGALRLGDPRDEPAVQAEIRGILAAVEEAIGKLSPQAEVGQSPQTRRLFAQLDARFKVLPQAAQDALHAKWQQERLPPVSVGADGRFRVADAEDDAIAQGAAQQMLADVEAVYETLPKTDVTVKPGSLKTFKPETLTQLHALKARIALLPPHTRLILEERWRKQDRAVHVLMRPDEDSMVMPQTVEDEEELQEQLAHQLAEVDDQLVQIQYQRNPAHVVALEQQLLAYRVNSLLAAGTPRWKREGIQHATVDVLKSAVPYCWSPQCVEAVATKASLLEPESRPEELEETCRIKPPGACGWWWFERPIPLKTVQGGEPIVALAWRREYRDVGHVLDSTGPETGQLVSVTWFNAFIHDATIWHGRPILAPNPTLAWVWTDPTPINVLEGVMRERFAAIDKSRRGGREAASDDDLVHAAYWLSTFWLAAGVWLESRLIGQQGMALPRQQGRQLAREHKLDHAPLVEVIYLRRPEPTPHERLAAATATGRKYDKWQWLVEEHARRQWYPSLGRHRLIRVKEHRKGNPDRPWKHGVKVYAVHR